MIERIEERLGKRAEKLLAHESKTIPKEHLHLPGPDFIDRVYALTDRNQRVLNNLARLFGSGRIKHHRPRSHSIRNRQLDLEIIRGAG